MVRFVALRTRFFFYTWAMDLSNEATCGAFIESLIAKYETVLNHENGRSLGAHFKCRSIWDQQTCWHTLSTHYMISYHSSKKYE